MNFLDDETYEVDYEHINLTILDGNFMNMALNVMEENYGVIDVDDSTYHHYYIIIFSSSPYTLQEYFSIYGKFISSGEMVYKGIYVSININYY